MKDEDYIRKAVELADGWEYAGHDSIQDWIRGPKYFQPLSQIDPWMIDALAAQLVRQVDALKPVDLRSIYIMIDGFGSVAVHDMSDMNYVKAHVSGPDRTMNTIKAIVDSKVLDND